MKNSMTVLDENNKEITIELLVKFRVESIGKEYIAYTLNDDGISKKVPVFISEICEENGILQIVPINDEEKEMVFLFYATLRDDD